MQEQVRNNVRLSRQVAAQRLAAMQSEHQRLEQKLKEIQRRVVVAEAELRALQQFQLERPSPL